MSGNNAATPRKIDRRVQRTRDALGDALVALIREKPLAAITVQNVLDRANVGRSTFYAHFRDKDDLFLSDVEDFFQSMASLLARSGDRSRRIAPVRELCAHVAEVKQFYSALVAAERIHDVLQLGEECFARAIDQRLAERFPEHAMPGLRGGTAVAPLLVGRSRHAGYAGGDGRHIPRDGLLRHQFSQC
jgi:AcrR family transcriptional regulator